ncbi:MAG TPA: nickel-binding protein [Candidatus Limnocylindrales bacterium]
MTEFLLETYLSRTAGDAIDAGIERARRAAEAVRREGRRVELLRTIFLPEDETCFFVYRAASADDVREAARRADLPTENVVQAVTQAARRPPARRAMPGRSGRALRGDAR